MDLPIALKLIISLFIGAAIGLEREATDRNTKLRHRDDTAPHSVGVRTFALITTLGTVSSFFLKDYMPVFILLSGTFMAILLAYYVINSIQTKDQGFTTETAIIFSYVIGILIGIELLPMPIIIAMAIILILILARKQDIKQVVESIHREEINAFISYALIGLAILPFLPDKSFTLQSLPFISNTNPLASVEIINPFKLWLIVALVTGIDMAGYALERVIGQNKGRLFTGLIGGFISSTATTISLAQESKQTKNVGPLVSAAVFANFASFFPIFFLIAPINGQFLLKSAPTLIALIIASLITGIYFLKTQSNDELSKRNKSHKNVKESEIFSLVPALKFAGIFLIIRILSKIALTYFGQAGFLVTSALGALTGIDAVVINIAELAGRSINTQTAVIALILVNAVNLIAKIMYSFTQGSKVFATRFAIAMSVVIAASFVGLFFK